MRITIAASVLAALLVVSTIGGGEAAKRPSRPSGGGGGGAARRPSGGRSRGEAEVEAALAVVVPEGRLLIPSLEGNRRRTMTRIMTSRRRTRLRMIFPLAFLTTMMT